MSERFGICHKCGGKATECGCTYRTTVEPLQNAQRLPASERDWRAEIEAVRVDGRSNGGDRRPHGDRALSAIDARDDLINALADQVDLDRGEIERLRAAYDADYDRIEAEREDADDAMLAARAEVARLRARLDALRAELDEARADRDRLERECAEWQRTAERLQGEADDLRALLREIVAWWDRIDAGGPRDLGRDTEDRIRAAITADEGGDDE